MPLNLKQLELIHLTRCFECSLRSPDVFLHNIRTPSTFHREAFFMHFSSEKRVSCSMCFWMCELITDSKRSPPRPRRQGPQHSDDCGEIRFLEVLQAEARDTLLAHTFSHTHRSPTTTRFHESPLQATFRIHSSKGADARIGRLYGISGALTHRPPNSLHLQPLKRAGSDVPVKDLQTEAA